MINNANLIWIPIESINKEMLDLFAIEEKYTNFIPIFFFNPQVEELKFSSINLIFGFVYGYNKINQTFQDENETKIKFISILEKCYEKFGYASLNEMMEEMPNVVKTNSSESIYKNFMKSFDILMNDISIKNEII